MNDLDASPSKSAEEAEPRRGYRDPSPSIRYSQSNSDYSERLVELEMENLRLHRLVAELLIKNQQLGKPD
jgi:hypothetical protein